MIMEEGGLGSTIQGDEGRKRLNEPSCRAFGRVYLEDSHWLIIDC